MAFKRIGSLNPHGGPLLRRYTLGNSITATEMDATEASSGFAILGTSANPLIGHVDSIVTLNGVGVEDNGSGSDFVGSYTTASDNQTVAQVGARVDVSKETLYSAEVSQAIGTTPGSNLNHYKMDLSDEDTLDETSAVTGTNSAQYATHGTDPADTTKAVVNLFESIIFGPLS